MEEHIKLAAMIFLVAVIPALFGLMFNMLDWISKIILTLIPQILLLIASVTGFFLILFCMHKPLGLTKDKETFRKPKPNNQQKEYALLRHKLTAIEKFYKEHKPDEHIEKFFNYLLDHFAAAYSNKDRYAALEEVNTFFLHELQLIETIFNHLDNQLAPTVLEGVQELVARLQKLQQEETGRLNELLQSEINIFKDLNKA